MDLNKVFSSLLSFGGVAFILTVIFYFIFVFFGIENTEVLSLFLGSIVSIFNEIFKSSGGKNDKISNVGNHNGHVGERAMIGGVININRRIPN